MGMGGEMPVKNESVIYIASKDSDSSPMYHAVETMFQPALSRNLVLCDP